MLFIYNQKYLENWYRDKAKEKMMERIKYYQANFDTKPKKIVIKDQQKRWGSCTKNHELRFNWRCIMAPSPVLDYIIVHEMCHMVHMNHSKWYARELQKVLEYVEWRNLLFVFEKAKIATANSNHLIEDHFVDVNNMVVLGSGAKRYR